MARSKKKGWGYVRAGIVPIDEVLPLILDPNVEKATFHGHRVNVVSLRLQTFATKGLCCSSCGLKASHFAVETKEGQEAWHLNLWADRSSEGKEEMLMTHDHTLARSLGGKDDISNVTTMCSKCNFKKSIGERLEYEKHREPTKVAPSKKRRTAKQQAKAEALMAHNEPLRTVPMELAVRQFRAAQDREAKRIFGVVGARIRKHSNKPFKCGEKIVTVEAMCTSLQDPKQKLAYVIVEDQSIVNVDQCHVI